MLDALLNTIIGMLSVFMVLVIICLIITALNLIPYLKEKIAAKKSSKTVSTNAQNEKSMTESFEIEEESDNNLELVAVIAAAISAYSGMSTSDFTVRQIKRRL